MMPLRLLTMTDLTIEILTERIKVLEEAMLQIAKHAAPYGHIERIALTALKISEEN